MDQLNLLVHDYFQAIFGMRSEVHFSLSNTVKTVYRILIHVFKAFYYLKVWNTMDWKRSVNSMSKSDVLRDTPFFEHI